MQKKINISGAIVLGMHDALVSLTGLIAGLTFSLADRYLIILSAIIASVTAGLSMGASEYLAEKTNDNPHALYAGTMTGVAYMVTCAILIVPFFVTKNTYSALMASMTNAVLMILICNLCIGHARGRPFWRHAVEMLVICAGVSIIAFMIGEAAKHILGVTI